MWLTFDGLVGAKEGTLTSRLPLRGLTSLPNGTTPGALGQAMKPLLNACGIGVHPFPGATATVAGSTTTQVLVVDAEGFDEGGLPVFVNGEARTIAAVGSEPPSITLS